MLISDVRDPFPGVLIVHIVRQGHKPLEIAASEPLSTRQGRVDYGVQLLAISSEYDVGIFVRNGLDTNHGHWFGRLASLVDEYVREMTSFDA